MMDKNFDFGKMAESAAKTSIGWGAKAAFIAAAVIPAISIAASFGLMGSEAQAEVGSIADAIKTVINDPNTQEVIAGVAKAGAKLGIAVGLTKSLLESSNPQLHSQSGPAPR